MQTYNNNRIARHLIVQIIQLLYELFQEIPMKNFSGLQEKSDLYKLYTNSYWAKYHCKFKKKVDIYGVATDGHLYSLLNIFKTYTISKTLYQENNYPHLFCSKTSLSILFKLY